jgi:hypothetical protein
MNTDTPNSSTPDYRRSLVLVLSIALLSVSGWMLWSYENTGTVKFVASASGRIGLVLAALWLAWPTLRKPASWLPPGFAVLGVLMLAILAAQPRAVVVMVPAFGALLALASFVRAMRQ